MNRKFLATYFIVLLVFSLILNSCGQEGTSSTAAATTSKTTKSAASTSTTSSSSNSGTSNWWDKFGEPQYGGTLTIRNAAMNSGSFDPIAGMAMAGGFASNLWLEGFTFFDWTLDRDVWAYPTGFTPIEYLKGHLAESWEQTAPDTIIMNIRHGVKWQNKEPVNGREFTAEDVVFNFDRILGTGHGYSAPSPYFASQYNTIEKATATDDYTVEFKLKKPGVMGLYQLLETSYNFVPEEWVRLADNDTGSSAGGIAQGGALTVAENTIGTGPFMVSEFIAGTSMTMVKNPDYWGYDERYPENKLPYVDQVIQLAIPDGATALAALRTGKVDMWTDMMGALSWQQGETLADSNPEIEQALLPRPASVVYFRCDTKPFNDIRVRKALQLSIDIPSIIKSYYNNTQYGTYCGLIAPVFSGWTLPYEEWPQEIKSEFVYDPDQAKELLAEAGYPDGFNTNCVIASNRDTKLMEVIKSYFAEVGVAMEIVVMEPATYNGFVTTGKHDQMVYNDGGAAMSWAPSTSFSQMLSASIPSSNSTYNNDATFDNMIAELNSAGTTEEMMRISREADMYALSQHWFAPITPSQTPLVWQPYVKGYSGEIMTDAGWSGNVRARLWVNQNEKETLRK